MKLDDDVKDEEISEADCERAEPSAKHQVHRGIIDNRLIVLTDRATFIEQVKRMEAKRSRGFRRRGFRAKLAFERRDWSPQRPTSQRNLISTCQWD